MDTIIRCAALALCGSSVGLLIKKYNPELSLALSLLIAVLLSIAAFKIGESVNDLADTVRTIIGTANTTVTPIFKCVAIAAVTKISSELCKDSNNGAVAASMELVGTMCAIGAAMPMVISMLKLIGEMI